MKPSQWLHCTLLQSSTFQLHFTYTGQRMLYRTPALHLLSSDLRSIHRSRCWSSNLCFSLQVISWVPRSSVWPQSDWKTDLNLIERFRELTIALDSSAGFVNLAWKLSMKSLGLEWSMSLRWSPPCLETHIWALVRPGHPLLGFITSSLHWRIDFWRRGSAYYWSASLSISSTWRRSCLAKPSFMMIGVSFVDAWERDASQIQSEARDCYRWVRQLFQDVIASFTPSETFRRGISGSRHTEHVRLDPAERRSLP